MNLYRIYEVSPGMTIVLFVIIVLILIAFIFLLARSFFKERKRILEEKALTIEGVLTRSEIHSIIASYIAKSNKETQFSLIYIDLDKFTDFVNAFGKNESEKIIEKIIKNVEMVLPKGVKIKIMKNDDF